MITIEMLSVLIWKIDPSMKINSVRDYNKDNYLVEVSSTPGELDESAKMILISKKDGKMESYFPMNDPNFLTVMSKKPLYSVIM